MDWYELLPYVLLMDIQLGLSPSCFLRTECDRPEYSWNEKSLTVTDPDTSVIDNPEISGDEHSSPQQASARNATAQVKVFLFPRRMLWKKNCRILMHTLIM